MRTGATVLLSAGRLLACVRERARHQSDVPLRATPTVPAGSIFAAGQLSRKQKSVYWWQLSESALGVCALRDATERVSAAFIHGQQ